MPASRSARSEAKDAFPGEKNPRLPRGDQALLLVSASEGDANMLYAAGFFVPDPFIFFQHKQKKVVVMSDLEIDRAKKQASADRVLSLSLYQRKLRKMGRTAALIDILDLDTNEIHFFLEPIDSVP